LDGCEFFCTPKELRLIAQGCRASRLPWVDGVEFSFTPTGLRPAACKTQPRWGRPRIACCSQGSREARQPWAMRRNRFAVKTRSINTKLATTDFLPIPNSVTESRLG
jgi:hypothetical protein